MVPIRVASILYNIIDYFYIIDISDLSIRAFRSPFVKIAPIDVYHLQLYFILQTSIVRLI
jgi:hypothetical protein